MRPARIHEVQTEIRFGCPPTRARTRWMFGFQRRFVRRWECETLIPNPGDFPHTSQTDATTTFLSVERRSPAVRDFCFAASRGEQARLPSPAMGSDLETCLGIGPSRTQEPAGSEA